MNIQSILAIILTSLAVTSLTATASVMFLPARVYATGVALPGSANSSNLHRAFALSPASTAATLSVYPAQVAPTGRPRVSGVGFRPLTDLQLTLACPDHRTEFDLGAARTDATGQLRTTVAIPELPPSPCRLTVRQDGTLLADTRLTIRPALLCYCPGG